MVVVILHPHQVKGNDRNTLAFLDPVPCPALADFLERAQVQQAGQKGPVDVDRRNVAQVQFPASNFSLANLSIKQVLLPLGICNCHVFKFGMITA